MQLVSVQKPSKISNFQKRNAKLQTFFYIKIYLAQCLYVLSDDNDPVIADLRANSTYHAILLAITRPQSSTPNGNASEMSDLSTEWHMAVRLLCTGE